MFPFFKHFDNVSVKTRHGEKRSFLLIKSLCFRKNEKKAMLALVQKIKKKHRSHNISRQEWTCFMISFWCKVSSSNFKYRMSFIIWVSNFPRFPDGLKNYVSTVSLFRTILLQLYSILHCFIQIQNNTITRATTSYSI